jgi:hypothetical protein
VAEHLGYGDTTEAVMHQGIFNREARRSLSHDDVAGIRYAMSGVNEIAGDADDYTFTLTYAGMVGAGGADIVIQFDNSQTGFAVAFTDGQFVGPDHIAITTSNIYFSDANVTWFFNQVSSVPEPGSLALMRVAAATAIGLRLRRRRAAPGACGGEAARA